MTNICSREIFENGRPAKIYEHLCTSCCLCYAQVTSVVDGNVIRVLTRMRLIGADSSTTPTNDFIWYVASVNR